MYKLLDNLYVYRDTCHVYVIKDETKATLIDFGNGDVLEKLPTIGVEEVTDILMTHHHRDQGQGLKKAIKAGIRVWVPHMEQDLFQQVDTHWQARELDNNYNNREDRFSLLEPIDIAGTLEDYSNYNFNRNKFHIIPTPGHTTGSISIQTNIAGKNVVFSGDLIAGPGKVWSIAATQWSYNGGEGIALSVLSLVDLKNKKLDLLLPSHGETIKNPNEAIDLLIERLSKLAKYRKQNPRLFELIEQPYENLTEHLLSNRTSMSNSYVLLSKSKKALIIDYGYDYIGGIAPGYDRASRRPWLYTIEKLKKQYGIEKIDVAIPTHYHDDHVAGLNLLNNVEGTEIWSPANFADVLEHPKKYDLPCLWYDPIPVDRVLPLDATFTWEEYEFRLYPMSGHTYYAVAIEFEVDGKRVLAQGDQYAGDGDEANYVYRNGFRIHDYVDSAKLLQTVRPDLMISGHWAPVEVTEDYLIEISEKGKELEQLHKELIPLDNVDFGASSNTALIRPYQREIYGGDAISYQVFIKNPLPDNEQLVARMIVPEGWAMDQEEIRQQVEANQSVEIEFIVTPPVGEQIRRARVAVDVTIGETRFGQLAEALVTVRK